MHLNKIISGCQTGADQGALFAAEALGLLTGGYMPKNYRTDEGPRVDLFYRFKLRVTSSTNYSNRTQLNVFESDATLIFGNPESPGCKLTRSWIKRYEKPSYTVLWPQVNYIADDYMFRAWLTRHSIKVLNVAGNRETKNPGIFEATKVFLILAINTIRLEEKEK